MENYLQVENLTKSFGDTVLFSNLNMTINEGDRVGLIARNGYGKTTLLNILTNREDKDSGSITFKRDLNVSYLVQDPQFPKGITVLEASFHGDSPTLKAIQQYEKAVEDNDQDALYKAIAKMDALEAWDYESKAKQILTKLKIEEFNKPVEQLSGGQVKRVALANALIVEPDLLILDEPTNHLDLEITTWLEEYLSKSKMSLLMVTHDRYYLDRVCNKILEIENKNIYAYNGNFNYYLEKRQERLDATAAQEKSDSNLYRKELEWMRRQPKARATKAKARIESFNELEDRLRKERTQGQVNLISNNTYIGKKIFDVENLCKKFDTKVILNDFSYTFSRYEKMGIVGENGVGKSTFIKMLLNEVAPDSGKIDIGTTVKFGYYSQQGGIEYNDKTKVIDVVTDIAEHIELNNGKTLSASQLLQQFLFTPQTQYNLVSKLSGGEKRRLYLCTVLMRSPNFLVLDEPTNDLDIMTLQVLEEYLEGFSGCLIVISHDRYFMDKVADHLMIFEGEGAIKDFPSSYTDYITWRNLKNAEERENTPQKKEIPKQQKSQVVDKPQKLTFKEKFEFERIELELEELECEKSTLENALNSGTLPVEELTKHSIQISEIIDRIDTITMRWLELSERA